MGITLEPRLHGVETGTGSEQGAGRALFWGVLRTGMLRGRCFRRRFTAHMEHEDFRVGCMAMTMFLHGLVG
jgi:hypothetical protein